MGTQTYHHTTAKSAVYAMVSFGHKEREGEKNTNVFVFAYSGMVDAANALDPDIKVEWHGPQAWDPIPEIAAIETLTKRGVDGIMVTAADKTALDKAINAAIEQGIPVINFDADSPDSARLTLVATDNYKAGYLAGQTMAAWLEGQGDVGISTIEHADHLIERLEGFKAAMEKFAPQSQLHIAYDSGSVAVDELGQQDFGEYRQSYMQLLKAHPNIRGLFTTYSIPGAGAAQAVEEMGLQEQVHVLSFDFDEIIIKLVETDKIQATVGQDPYMMGYVSMILLHAARHTPKLPVKGDDSWRVPALVDFLQSHPKIHQNTAAKLKAIIDQLEAGPAEIIDTGARILGKEELLDILARDFEDMRDSISEKIEFLGREVEIRKQAEQELHQLNAELEQRIEERTAEIARQAYILDAFLENVPDTIYFKDLDSRITKVNQALVDRFGVNDAADIVGKTDFDFFSTEEAQPKYDLEQEIIHTGEPILNVEEPDTGGNWALTTKMPLRDEHGQIIGTFGISKDITPMKQAQEAIAEQARQLQTVAEVGTTISTILDTATLLQQVVDITKERFGLYHAHIYLLNEAGDALDLATGAGEAGQKMVAEGWRIPLLREQSLVAQTARTGQAIMVNNVQDAPEWLPNPLLPETRSELAVPLIVGDKVLGVFDVQADTAGYFADEDIGIHTMLATQVAATLQNVNLFSETAQRATELETLNQISQQLSTMLDPEKLVPMVVDQIGTAFNYYYTQIYMFDETRENLVVAGGTGELGQRLVARQHSLPKGRGLVGRAAEQNKIVLVPDVQRHVGVEIVTQTNVESIYQREVDPAVEDEWYTKHISEHFGDVKALVDWLNMLSDQAGPSLKLGYVLHVGGVFPNMMRRGVEAAARDLQIEVELVAPERESKHLPLFEEMVERGVDGLVVVPDKPEWVASIEQAMAADIPVITANRDLKSSPALMHVGLDNFQAGMILARELTGLLNRAGKDEGKILVSTGVADRIAGVRHGLRHSNYTLIEIEGFLEESSFLKTYWEQAINHHPDAIAVMGLTVSEAPILAEIKRRLGGQWLVGGFDLELETLEAIRDGTVQVTIGQHTYLQAYLPILALVEHIRLGIPLQSWMAEGWLPNALLPQTKTEVAVPITLGNEVLGVLDVQNNITGSLKPENANLLHSVAGQVAVALTNARLFDETSRSKEEAEVAKEKAEAAREKAEQAQQRAEQSRVEAEQARAEAEQARREAEQAKKDIEVANKALEVQIWQTKGQAQLNDKMRGEQDIETLANNVIDQLCEYLPAQTGALYVMEDDSLYRAGHYAYNPNGATRFKLREGLVGQAAAKKQPLFLTDIPPDHLTVRSGFGEATLRHIMVFPFMYEGLVGGVIELGTLTEFSQVQIDFMDAAITNIGITFNTAQVRARVNELLTETQQQTEELQVQGEELRVANEELQSQTESLQASEAKLKEQQAELETTNTQLEEKAAALEESSAALQEKQNILDQQNRELMVAQQELERKAKELELASKYKSEFLANMSHELRTPLNSLLILSRMLADNKDGNLTEEQVESSQIIYSGGTDLLNLINDILDLSKVEAGQMIFTFESMPLTDLVSSMRMQFDPVAEEKELDFIVNLAEDLPGRINTDQQRVKQIIKNLLSNAFKFTKEGSVSLSLYRPDSKVDLSRSGLDLSQAIAISVTDSGIGMTSEQLQVIFEAFQQADGSTSRQYGGTGLGLSICRELAANLGGQIEVESTPGQGSTFTLYLPIEKQAGDGQKTTETQPESTEKQQDAAQLEPEPQERALAPETPARVVIADDRDQLSDNDKTLLVIEDDPKFAKIMLNYAHKKTFKCLVAGDGRSGLQLVNAYQPHAIILDLNLPDISGWEVLEVLKNDPTTRHIPVHIMSVDDEDLTAYKKGAMGYLTKPVSQEHLENAFGEIEHFISQDIKTLLLVEDDANARLSVKKLLDGSDVQISEAETGQQALDLLQTQHYDCMILDLSLPDMSGFAVLNKINADDQIAKCPIIVYTGRDLTPEENDELMKYANRVIVKGVKSPERLLDETALFLHRVVADMSKDKQQAIKQLYNKDGLLQDKKIMIVDDDMRNSFALSKLLSEKGIIVKIARDGQKALDMLAEDGDVDLILMDIMMPVLDGYETTKQIRAQRKFKTLPILALTAKAMKGDREKCLEVGANDYLSKPIDIDRLFSMLQVWLYR